MRRIILTLSLLIFPLAAFALPSLFDSPASDQSLTLLGHIFGVVGDLQLGVGRGIGVLGSMFRIFNEVVIALGVIVLMYTLVISTVNTAQEGELMGRKWSSIWIPMRSVIGTGLLVPSASGYSLIQILNMWIVMQGVGAANYLWTEVLDFYQERGPVAYIDTAPPSTRVVGIKDFGRAVMKTHVCIHTLNNLIPNANIEPYTVTNPSNPTSRTIRYGSQTENSLQAICGEISFDYSSNAPEQAEFEALLQSAQMSGVAAVGSWVDAVAYDMATRDLDSPSSTTPAGYSEGAQAAYVNRMIDFYVGSGKATSNQAWVDKARNFGWSTAGASYFSLSQSRSMEFNSAAGTAPEFNIVPDSASSAIPADIYNEMRQRMDKAVDYYNNSPPIPKEGLDLTFVSNTSKAGAIEKVFKSSIGKIGEAIIDGLVTNVINQGNTVDQVFNSNPILQLRSIGSSILQILEVATFLIAVVSIGIIGAAGGGFVSVSVGLGIFAMIFTVMISIMVVINALLYVCCATWAYYFPMVPYIVFLFSFISWLIMVFEAIVASPLIAIGLISPSQDELGRAGQSIILIVNVFLRPPLMIFGFVAAIYFLKIGFYLLNFGFVEVFKSSAGSVTITGTAAVMTIYTGILTLIVHKAFSLIYLIPDRVVRWIGYQGEGMAGDVGQTTQEAKQTAQQGMQRSQKLDSGATKYAGQKASEAQSKSGATGGQGGGGGAQVN